ncbi:MAG: hypothetical protein JO283_14200 [Bradyrhizobium sp.]|nr:hypothetical protein [Bradyrhizobium sp.]
MNWALTTSLDDLWRLSAFPMWLTLAAAGFFGMLVLVTLMRAEKSVATGALTVITLLALGIAAAATIRGSGPSSSRAASSETRLQATASAVLPALSCLDDLAGDIVLSACEKAVFRSAESAAAAVSYAAAQVSRLTAAGELTMASKSMTPELQGLRRAIERDRYGLVAQVLQVRDRCMPTQCAVFRSLTDNHQIVANMDEHLYERLVTRHAAMWDAPPATAAGSANPALGALAAYPPSLPTGKPTNAEFPSAASTPAVSIMTPEPGTGTATPRSASATTASGPSAQATPGSAQAPAFATAKKPPPKPHLPPAAPVQNSPAQSAPAASND